MCLDYGTFGTYVSRNTIKRNGDRNRQTDEDLEADFILGLGRLADGSSTAKLPGISIDNSAYNTIYNNIIIENSGSGVKMVRSSYRNLILSNSIIDNNAGQNEAYHGFGIELGHASTPDEPVIGLDFTADYENIIARNVISGHHYSGIYLAEDTYCNDLIDNVIMDCGSFSVENFRMYFNSSVGNNTNVGTLNFDLK
jgi:parallel beta-helix repeat protein